MSSASRVDSAPGRQVTSRLDRRRCMNTAVAVSATKQMLPAMASRRLASPEVVESACATGVEPGAALAGFDCTAPSGSMLRVSPV